MKRFLFSEYNILRMYAEVVEECTCMSLVKERLNSRATSGLSVLSPEDAKIATNGIEGFMDIKIEIGSKSIVVPGNADTVSIIMEAIQKCLEEEDCDE